MITPNAIERVLRDESLVSHYGDKDIEHKVKAMLARIPLDEQTDTPLPDWAISILRDRTVGYRSRIKMVFMHHWDITDVNPDQSFVQLKDKRSAPDKPIPPWLVEFRAKRAAIAKEYIERKEKEETK